jgi:high-affinity iron transporter
MMGSAVIIFREVLEAALIVAIVLGVTRDVTNRSRWVAGGIILGIVAAIISASFAEMISTAVDGRGQELLNATILLAAVVMLTWHNVWMSSHGRALASQMKVLGQHVSMGAKPLSALALVTFFAVFREGAETVLFLYSLIASGAGSSGLLTGGILGLIGGIAVGWLLYRGLLSIPIGHFFKVTGWLILLLAAGLAANAAGYLYQANLVPVLVPQVWDTSWLLSQDSWLGELLHILVGYNDRPSGIQLLFYAVTLITIYTLMKLFGQQGRQQPQTAVT